MRRMIREEERTEAEHAGDPAAGPCDEVGARTRSTRPREPRAAAPRRSRLDHDEGARKGPHAAIRRRPTRWRWTFAGISANEPVLGRPAERQLWRRASSSGGTPGCRSRADFRVLLVAFAGARTIQAGRIARERDEPTRKPHDRASLGLPHRSVLEGFGYERSTGQRTDGSREAIARLGAARSQPAVTIAVPARLEATIGSLIRVLGCMERRSGCWIARCRRREEWGAKTIWRKWPPLTPSRT